MKNKNKQIDVKVLIIVIVWIRVKLLNQINNLLEEWKMSITYHPLCKVMLYSILKEILMIKKTLNQL